MKKRIAYIGLSYPLLYDYKHQADKTPNDLSDSPNPIIESPLGLMVLYDEILFLCRSICPNNMRNLPYIKFVDELYPDFDFEGIEKFTGENNTSFKITKGFFYNDITKLLNVEGWGADNHTHSLQIGSINRSAVPNEDCFLFDLNIWIALQNLYESDIEFVTNSRFSIPESNSGITTELTDRLIISNIPNYISFDGPYHECIEELRENMHLSDFRRWVIGQSSSIQRTEISEMCTAVEKNIEETKERVFKKYLDNNSNYSFFKSTASTIIKTVSGIMLSTAPDIFLSTVFPNFLSVYDANTEIKSYTTDFNDAKNIRWQGFIIDARNVLKKI